MKLFLYLGNDNLIRLEDLRDATNGFLITTATVTAQLKQLTGEDVGSLITMPHVVGATYEGISPKAVTLVEDTKYLAEVTADDGVGRVGFWNPEVTAVKRKEQ